AELLLTRDLGSECINIGVVFMKSHPANAKFLQDLIIWLWHHPYEFCQKAFAGLMGLEDLQWNSLYGNTVLSMAKPLDGQETRTGSSSITTWTAPVRWTLRSPCLRLTSLDLLHPQWTGLVRGYVNLFDLFYANDKLNLSDPVTPLYLQDEQVKSQLDFSRHPAPIKLQPCSHIEESAYPSWKQRQRAQLRERRELWPVQL
ncbi:Nucleotid_trans domain-containing protein, partial [Durusdinium trenchii]